MDLRKLANDKDSLWQRRLDEIVPDLMNRHGLEAWVIDAREYNEDPVAATMLPATWLNTARRRTILVFKDHGASRGAISRYPVGAFPPVWDPDESDQFQALTAFLEPVAGKVGINTSNVFALADGLTSSEHQALVRSLDDHHLVPADSVAIGWLETRLDEEIPHMAEACSIAHELLRTALSDEVITPGSTSTEDVAWWLAQSSHDAGYRIWFHPGVTVQREGDSPTTPAEALSDRTIEPGDLVHVDFGIVRDGYHTDQQQHAYVVPTGAKGAPDSFVDGLRQANRLQDILMETMVVGRSGNEALARARKKAIAEGIRPVIYTHPIGLHGHAAGATIGLWDNQDGVEGAGDYPIGENTGWSIELAVEINVREWGNQPAKIMLEEDAFLSGDGVDFLDGRQEELWLVR